MSGQADGDDLVVVDTRRIDFHPAIVDAYEVLQPVLAGVTRRHGMLPSDQQLEAELAAAIPLRRIPTDDDCAGAGVFLSADLSRAMTGALLDVNGGQFMAN